MTPAVKIPIYYLHQVAQIIGDMGMDLNDWLARSGLRASQLDDTQQSLSFAIFRQLMLDAISMTHEPALGLLVGNRLLLNTHGVLGYAAMNCATLLQAIEVIERYSLLRTPLLGLNYQTVNQQLHVSICEKMPLGDISNSMQEAAVLGVKNMIDYLAAGSQTVSRVMFSFSKPGYFALAEEILRCEVVYAQAWTGFVLPMDAATKPLNRADPHTYREALLICQRELDKIIQDESLAMRLRRVLIERSNAFPSLQLTARLFHMTPRTLHRKLLEEGTSYRDLLDDVRYSLAVEHLKSDRLSIQEIAFALGYTDLANFRRAFKRWEGVAPSDFRQQTLISSTSPANP